jgi:hypothetical protein
VRCAVPIAAAAGQDLGAGSRYALIGLMALAMGAQNATARQLALADHTTTDCSCFSSRRLPRSRSPRRSSPSSQQQLETSAGLRSPRLKASTVRAGALGRRTSTMENDRKSLGREREHGDKSAALESHCGPAVTAIATLPEFPVGEAGEEAAIAGEQCVGHCR